MNYREYYSRLLYVADREKSKTIIENDSSMDSADVYERIFLSCSDEVFILARGIKEEIFNFEKVRNAVFSFLQKENAKLRLILRIKNEDDYKIAMTSSFLKAIRERKEFEDKISVKFYEGDDNWLKDVGSTTIGDKRIYRHRYFQNDYDTSSNAHVCFNSEEACLKYKEKITTALEGVEPKFTHPHCS